MKYFNQLIHYYENAYIPKKPSLYKNYEVVRNAVDNVGHLRVEIIKLQNKIREIELAIPNLNLLRIKFLLDYILPSS